MMPYGYRIAHQNEIGGLGGVIRPPDALKSLAHFFWKSFFKLSILVLWPKLIKKNLLLFTIDWTIYTHITLGTFRSLKFTLRLNAQAFRFTIIFAVYFFFNLMVPLKWMLANNKSMGAPVMCDLRIRLILRRFALMELCVVLFYSSVLFHAIRSCWLSSIFGSSNLRRARLIRPYKKTTVTTCD